MGTSLGSPVTVLPSLDHQCTKVIEACISICQTLVLQLESASCTSVQQLPSCRASVALPRSEVQRRVQLVLAQAAALETRFCQCKNQLIWSEQVSSVDRLPSDSGLEMA